MGQRKEAEKYCSATEWRKTWHFHREGIMPSEISQTERQMPYVLTCMWDLMSKATKLIDKESRLMVARGG